MRVKVKGFEVGKCYAIISEDGKTEFSMKVYFGNKNYVKVSYFDSGIDEYKNYTTSKRYFKEFIKLPFPISNQEIDPYDFFLDYSNKVDYSYEEGGSSWPDYACENGCCACCGCSCFYDADDEYDCGENE